MWVIVVIVVTIFKSLALDDNDLFTRLHILFYIVFTKC